MAKGFLSKPPEQLTARQQKRVDYLNQQKAAGKQVNSGVVGKQQAAVKAGGPNLQTAQGALKATNKAIDQHVQRSIQLNRPGMSNPYGSRTVDENGNVTDSLSAAEQQKLEQGQQVDTGLGNVATGLVGQAGEGFEQPFDYSQLPDLPGQEGLDAYRQQMVDKTYEMYSRPIEQRQQQEMEDFEQMAAERGWSPGSEVYNNQRQLRMQQNENELNDARAKAMQLGGDEMSRGYSIGTGIYESARDRALAQRYQGLNDLNAVRGSISGVNNPSFYNISNQQIPFVNPAEVGTSYMNAYAQQLAASKSGGGGGSEGPDWLTKQKILQDMARENFLWEQSHQPQYEE